MTMSKGQYVIRWVRVILAHIGHVAIVVLGLLGSFVCIALCAVVQDAALLPPLIAGSFASAASAAVLYDEVGFIVEDLDPPSKNDVVFSKKATLRWTNVKKHGQIAHFEGGFRVCRMADDGKSMRLMVSAPDMRDVYFVRGTGKSSLVEAANRLLDELREGKAK